MATAGKTTDWLHGELQIRGFTILRDRWKLGWVTQELMTRGGQLDVCGKRVSQRHVVVLECKATRADLLSELRSEKWRECLPYCNELWFYVNRGICEPYEIPPEAGLITATNSEHVLYRTQKKAMYREVRMEGYLNVIEAMFSASYWRRTIPDRLRRVRGKQEDRHQGKVTQRLQNQLTFLETMIARLGIEIDVPQMKIIRSSQKGWKGRSIAERRFRCPGCEHERPVHHDDSIKGMMIRCYECDQYAQIAGEIQE